MKKNREILKSLNIPADKVLINEYFISIQGEGYHTGKPAFFIRFSGCDIGCQWCDTKDAISLKNSSLVEISGLVKLAIDSGIDMVVITGGEPALHDLSMLCEHLKESEKKIHLETSGAYPVSGVFDWMSLSPKIINPPIPENYKKANELKVVIKSKADFSFAEQQVLLVNKECELFLQPECGASETILPQIIDYIIKHPKWRLSLQMHKYVGIK